MLTADEAYAKHIEMWTAMREKLGDNPSFLKRVKFKQAWCEEHGENVEASCYLCQYDKEQHEKEYFAPCGERCIVDWGTVVNGEYRGVGCGFGKTRYKDSPISEILALPRREVSEQ